MEQLFMHDFEVLNRTAVIRIADRKQQLRPRAGPDEPECNAQIYGKLLRLRNSCDQLNTAPRAVTGLVRADVVIHRAMAN